MGMLLAEAALSLLSLLPCLFLSLCPFLSLTSLSIPCCLLLLLLAYFGCSCFCSFLLMLDAGSWLLAGYWLLTC